MKEIIIQGIGFSGLLAFISSYQIKSNKKLFLIQMVGVLLFALQFLLMGAFSGCLSLLLTAVRNIMMSKYNDWKWIKHKACPLLICVLFTVILVFTWAGPISLPAYIASVVSTIFYWTNDARKLRLANLFVCSPAWIIYDSIVGSIGGIVSESLTMISIIVSIYRFGWKNKEQTHEGEI